MAGHSAVEGDHPHLAGALYALIARGKTSQQQESSGPLNILIQEWSKVKAAWKPLRGNGLKD